MNDKCTNPQLTSVVPQALALTTGTPGARAALLDAHTAKANADAMSTIGANVAVLDDVEFQPDVVPITQADEVMIMQQKTINRQRLLSELEESRETMITLAKKLQRQMKQRGWEILSEEDKQNSGAETIEANLAGAAAAADLLRIEVENINLQDPSSDDVLSRGRMSYAEWKKNTVRWQMEMDYLAEVICSNMCFVFLKCL